MLLCPCYRCWWCSDRCDGVVSVVILIFVAVVVGYWIEWELFVDCYHPYLSFRCFIFYYFYLLSIKITPSYKIPDVFKSITAIFQASDIFQIIFVTQQQVFSAPMWPIFNEAPCSSNFLSHSTPPNFVTIPASVTRLGDFWKFLVTISLTIDAK